MAGFWVSNGRGGFELRSPVHKTRFAGLGYANFGRGHWQFVGLDSPLPSNPCGYAQTGPIYPTKAELLADAQRFAREYGLA